RPSQPAQERTLSRKDGGARGVAGSNQPRNSTGPVRWQSAANPSGGEEGRGVQLQPDVPGGAPGALRGRGDWGRDEKGGRQPGAQPRPAHHRGGGPGHFPGRGQLVPFATEAAMGFYYDTTYWFLNIEHPSDYPMGHPPPHPPDWAEQKAKEWVAE